MKNKYLQIVIFSLFVGLLFSAATTVEYLMVDSLRNSSQEVQFSNAANYFYGDGSNLTNVPAGSASNAGDSVISYGHDILYLRWTGHYWMVDRSYGTWTDNN